MRDIVILFVHVFVTICRLWGPGGIRSVVAESVLVKQQLLILKTSSSISGIITTATARILPWRDEHPTMTQVHYP
jgi:hypothetical protein